MRCLCYAAFIETRGCTMLTREDNELICRTGPGTPMGRVLRRYWHPCLLSADLPDNDCRPVRVRLLGEDLVAFRDSEGRVGLIDERCPHQGVSMYYGIPAGGALMCIHHGWKFDVDGNCVGMPSSEPESQFMETVHTTSYPVVESAGMVWTYMGPPELQPLPPDFLFNRLPDSHVIAARVPVYCNYLQSIEGNIDSSHLGTLHRRYSDFALEPDDSDRPGTPSPQLRSYLLAHYRYAVIHVQDTDYGFRLIGIRPTDAGHRHLRITSHVFPVCSMIASPGLASGSFFIVPVDDENCMRFFVRGNPDRPFTAAEREAAFAENTIMDPADPRRRLKRADNDYMIDRAAQKTTLISGILPNAEQDYAVTESMGPIMDRTSEHLYSADGAIIRLRQLMVRAAKGIDEGVGLPALDPAIPYHRIRSEEVIVREGDDPWLAGADAGETASPGERLW